jgi:kynurenine formamidase
MYSLIDLTQTLTDESLSYPGAVPAWTAERSEIGCPGATVTRFSVFDPHAGTHLDAPLHFAPDGADLAELPLHLYPAIVIRVDGSRVEAVSVPDDCAGHAVLFSTGWESRAGTSGYFESFPSIAPEAAQCLVDRRVGLVGVDSPSVDSGAEHPSYPAHKILCGAGVPIVEGLVNLRPLLSVDGELLFAAFPLKLAGVEGSPVRAVALVREHPAGD